MKTALVSVTLGIAGLAAITSASTVFKTVIFPGERWKTNSDAQLVAGLAVFFGFIISAAMIGIAYGIASSR